MSLPEQIGRYRIVRQLGEGAMGVVYEARDEELDRAIAIKIIAEANADALAHERFRREARAAARIRHPNICQVYEIGEQDGTLFIAMELLEGESLTTRIQRGPLTPADAVSIALETLSALGALHASDMVHRDLKPSNIFLGPYGVRLLDFGLAKHASVPESDTGAALTQEGMAVGTPEYMAPEQFEGVSDGRTDLYALGAILFEMLTGSRPFKGLSPTMLYHAALTHETPAIAGFASAPAIDKVVRRAMAKRIEDRFDSAAAMALALEAASDDPDPVPSPRAMTCLVILPFRVLRPDPDTDFLGFSIPDAVGNALSGLRSLAVRSPAVAARFATDVLDLAGIAREAEADVLLTGTIVRAGNRMRVTTQLIELPSGALLWSHTPEVSLQDLFQLQDEVVHGIVDSLSLSLTARERRLLKHDVPATAKAYEFYLRANQASQAATSLDPDSWAVARDLYRQCLEEDPNFAPAWARVGRIHRVTAKWARSGYDANMAEAEAAFKRALEINPDLSVAHNLYAQLEVDVGRAEGAMLRLVGRALVRGADPELFAGLVHACRFCGLLDASIAAHREARRLDPAVATSVGQTWFMLGEYANVIAEDLNTTPGIRNFALIMLGREAEALANLRALEARLQTKYGDYLRCAQALLEGRREDTLALIDAVLESGLRDPEAIFHLSRFRARLGDHRGAIALLADTIRLGFFCYPTFARDPWLDPLRDDAAFIAVMHEAKARHMGAMQAFASAGGERVLR